MKPEWFDDIYERDFEPYMLYLIPFGKTYDTNFLVYRDEENKLHILNVNEDHEFREPIRDTMSYQEWYAFRTGMSIKELVMTIRDISDDLRGSATP